MPPAINIIEEFPAALAVLRPHDGSRALVVVNADYTARRIWPLARIVLNRGERWALWQAMAGQ
jgi:hypothetical protein